MWMGITIYGKHWPFSHIYVLCVYHTSHGPQYASAITETLLAITNISIVRIL